MKELFAVAIALALLIGAGAFAVERFDDRELFVPPPDAVAEGFVRAVSCGRYAQARAFLEEPSSKSDDDLRTLDESLGEPWSVEAKTISRDESRAVVNVEASGPKDAHAMDVELVFDREWKIRRSRSRA